MQELEISLKAALEKQEAGVQVTRPDGDIVRADAGASCAALEPVTTSVSSANVNDLAALLRQLSRERESEERIQMYRLQQQYEAKLEILRTSLERRDQQHEALKLQLEELRSRLESDGVARAADDVAARLDQRATPKLAKTPDRLHQPPPQAFSRQAPHPSEAARGKSPARSLWGPPPSADQRAKRQQFRPQRQLQPVAHDRAWSPPWASPQRRASPSRARATGGKTRVISEAREARSPPRREADDGPSGGWMGVCHQTPVVNSWERLAAGKAIAGRRAKGSRRRGFRACGLRR